MSLVQTREQVPRLAAGLRRPVHAGAGAPAPGITVRDMLRIVRKRKWLILTTFVICMGAVFTGTLLWWLYAPLYTAEALLEVVPPQLNIMDSVNPMYPREVIERHKRTQAALVKHQPVLETVAANPNVTNKTWYSKHKDEVIQSLDDKIDVSLMPDTQLIKLSMTGTERYELADIVNAVADAFVRYARDNTRRQREDQISKLKVERASLRDSLNTIRNTIASVRAASPWLPASETRRSMLTVRLQLLTEEINKAEMEKAQADAALDALQQEMNDGSLANNFQVLQALDMDPMLRAMSVRLLEEKTLLDNQGAKFGPQHRSVQSLKASSAALEQQLEAKRQEIIRTQVESIGQMRKMVVAMATQRLKDLTDRLNLARSEARDVEEAVRQIEARSQEAQDTEGNLRAVEKRLLELELLGRAARPGEEATDIGPVSLYAHAVNPRTIAQPKWYIMMPLGALLGLVLSLGLAFLLELGDTSVKSPSDIARRVDLPLLGMVPHSDDLEEEIEDFRRVTLLAPHSPAAEAFRQIRTNLLFSGPAQERRSLLVTSPAPEDGRTTVVMNLAIAMAQAGRRVLVVDANFRQPVIAAMFPQAAAAGLSSALVGQAAWRDVVSPSGVPNLSVITSGPLPPNPAELLGSDLMRQLVAEMVAEYDQVLIDGSPVMVVSDAAVLSTQVDGVILVIRAGSNSIGIVQRATDQLHRVGARIVGAVLQGVRSTAGGYLRKNYETFYEYQQKTLP